MTISMLPPASALDPMAARSLVGLAGLSTIVELGPDAPDSFSEVKNVFISTDV